MNEKRQSVDANTELYVILTSDRYVKIILIFLSSHDKNDSISNYKHRMEKQKASAKNWSYKESTGKCRPGKHHKQNEEPNGWPQQQNEEKTGKV